MQFGLLDHAQAFYHGVATYQAPTGKVKTGGPTYLANGQWRDVWTA